MFTKTTATREKVKLLVGLTGPSGSGKTYSALQLAKGIAGEWSKIALADTENRSALYYAGLGPWQHVEFSPNLDGGYHPHNWIKLIDFIEKDETIDVLILDSISHEWEGRGGCLEIIDKINKGFSGWKQVTPMHGAFIDRMRHSRLHIIATMRSKTDYVVEQNDKGKPAPKKVGLKSSQREGIDYEFGLIFDVEMNHYATSAKDRTGIFAERGPFQISETLGAELLNWTKTADVEAPSADPVYTAQTVEQMQWLVSKTKEFGLTFSKPELKNLSDSLVRGKLTLSGVLEYLGQITLPKEPPKTVLNAETKIIIDRFNNLVERCYAANIDTSSLFSSVEDALLKYDIKGVSALNVALENKLKSTPQQE